jgi:hypothetical protein
MAKARHNQVLEPLMAKHQDVKGTGDKMMGESNE